MDDIKEFSKIESIKNKKQLLQDYINDINKDNEKLNVQKNDAVLGGLNINLKKINEENVIMDNNGQIEKIIGLDLDDGLLIMKEDVLYKKKAKKNKST